MEEISNKAWNIDHIHDSDYYHYYYLVYGDEVDLHYVALWNHT